MGKRRSVLLLLVMGLFVFSVGAADHHPHVNSKAKQATLEVHKKLKLLNKPGVKTIKSEDGDIVDCVHIYKQPAFDHPALRNHKIQAAILVTVGYSYIGAQGDINIWNPKVESPDEFTTAQIWLKNGPGDAFESVESGWVVNPKVYGDGSTRLFVYWTKDAYKSTGCFDLTCSGFVQTNKDIALGMALQPISSASGPQYQTTFSITKDFHTNNWWVRVGQNIPVGYFPGELFSYLTKGAASLVEWGGEVYSSKIKKNHPHTATGMGSGDFAWNKEGNACYIKQVRIIDYSQQLKYPEWVGTFTDEEYCYAAVNYAASLAEEPVFYFGGPGLHPPDCN
ncbi:hypothetical protein C1H46_034338 [Malus baccata]|uniref:Neprosin PEP catalytic domain-containing protein n=1 Tax=Malus baccata TaxID=106549 RepID=A0A540L0W5_MALBA|nr:hypothetical protein C1H46_034338 [Malus baccata]